MNTKFRCTQNKAFTVFPQVQLHRGTGCSVQGVGRREIIGKVVTPVTIWNTPHALLQSPESYWQEQFVNLHSYKYSPWIFRNIFVRKKVKWIRICFKMSIPWWVFVCLFLVFFLFRQGRGLNMFANVGKSFCLRARGETCRNTDCCSFVTHRRELLITTTFIEP